MSNKKADVHTIEALIKMLPDEIEVLVSKMNKGPRGNMIILLLKVLNVTRTALQDAERTKETALEEITNKTLRVERLEAALREAQAQLQDFKRAEAVHAEDKMALMEEIARWSRGFMSMQELMNAQQRESDALIALTRNGFDITTEL